MVGANLRDVNLSRTLLFEADMRFADLSKANLSGTDLSSADLSGADLSRVDLPDTCLRKAIVTQEQLKSAKSLKNAIMPDG